MKGFEELEIKNTRDINDGVQHATLMNVVGATGPNTILDGETSGFFDDFNVGSILGW